MIKKNLLLFASPALALLLVFVLGWILDPAYASGSESRARTAGMNSAGSEVSIPVEGLPGAVSQDPLQGGGDPSYTCLPAPNMQDLVSYWTMDDGPRPAVIRDVVSGINAACVDNRCPQSVEGRIAGGYLFNSFDRVDVPNDPRLNWGTNDSFSIEVWVNKTEPCTPANQVFIGKYQEGEEGSTAWWVGCSVDTNQAAFLLRDTDGGGDLTTVTSPMSIADGGWHQIVAVRDGAANVNRLYVDGALAGSKAVTYSSAFESPDELNIGYFYDRYAVTGILDEVAIFRSALTADQVETHYNDGQGLSFCINQRPEVLLETNTYLPFLRK